ncbi:uncharacterized protein LOC141672765 isoform X2 [Apium graveolens]|uniref:uncharacterized protein LOC141672765 isoform X2 n=1 Tax=Apium graveolens TaxID=4045 RepID=UPI003D7BC5FD
MHEFRFELRKACPIPYQQEVNTTYIYRDMGGKTNGDQKVKAPKKVVPTWQEKKAVVDREEDAIEQEIQEQKQWIAMMKGMDNEGMKKYLSNRPDHLKAKNLEKCEPGQRICSTADEEKRSEL